MVSVGVGNNSIQSTSCQKWVHRKCSGMKGSMSKVMKSFLGGTVATFIGEWGNFCRILFSRNH